MDKCLHPRYYRGKVFPCQKCPSCLSVKREELAQRIMIEQAVSKCSYFITLTYDDEHLPFNEDIGWNCFDKDQVRRFIRSLRDSYRDDNINFRYFVTSEYGDNTGRSHYHAIFFFNSFQSRQQVYEDIKKRWTFGNISVDSVTMASARYVAKYCLKDDGTEDLPNGHPNKPFRLFSQKPAIGCSPEALKWYRDNFHLQERYIHLDECNFVKNSKLIDKIPRVVRKNLVTIKYQKKIKIEGKYKKVTYHVLDEKLNKRLSSVGWSKFFSMADDLYKSLNDKTLNKFDGHTVTPIYKKDLEIKEKARKFRKIKKTSL